MKNFSFKLIGVVVASLVAIALTFFIFKTDKIENTEINAEIEPEYGKPKESVFSANELTGSEKQAYDKWKSRLKKNGYSAELLDQCPIEDFAQEKELRDAFKTPEKKQTISENNTYADGDLSGKWIQQNFAAYGGYRVVNSVYDNENNVFYMVASSGHLYKVDTAKTGNTWNLCSYNKNYTTKGFNGVVLPNGKFRLFYIPSSGGAQYSDDDGWTWKTSNGLLVESGDVKETLVVKNGIQRKIVMRVKGFSGGSPYQKIYISNDYGLNYSELGTKWRSDQNSIAICAPYFSNDTYAFSRENSTGRLSVYKLDFSGSDFNRIQNLNINMPALKEVIGTRWDNKIHFYAITTDNTPYYSSNQGASWAKTGEPSGTIEAMNPYAPSFLYRGFTEVFQSTNFGQSYTKWNSQFNVAEGDKSHRLYKAGGGSHYYWDIEQVAFHQKKNGSYFAFFGTHFGAYASANLNVADSWVGFNDGTPIMMIYDMDYSEIFDNTFVALQDRGIQAWHEEDVKDLKTAVDIVGTDGLRVNLGKDESTLWGWLYYGTLLNFTNTVPISKSNVKKDFYENWFASVLVPSPDDNSAYVCNGTQLEKITRANGVLTKTLFPYIFPQKVTSLAISKINPDKWAVSLEDGKMMYSHNRGASWSNSSKLSGYWPQQSNANAWRQTRQVIVFSEIDENLIYVGGVGNRFLKSTDGGKTYSNMTNGLSIDRIRDFVLSEDEKYIYAACGTKGPWVYSTQKGKWYNMKTWIVPYADYTSVVYMDSRETVRFGTYGNGVLDYEVKSPLKEDKTFTLSHKTISKPLEGISGGNLALNNMEDDNSFVWKFIDQGQGYFKIQNVSSNLYLSSLDGAAVKQVSSSNNNNQKWRIIKRKGGTVHIVNKAYAKRLYTNPSKGIVQIVPMSQAGDWTQWRMTEIDEFTVTSISEINSNIAFNFYPNPVKENLRVTLQKSVKQNNSVVVKILTTSGIEVKDIKLKSGNEVSINVSDLTSGAYVISVNLGNEQTTQKFIKK